MTSLWLQTDVPRVPGAERYAAAPVEGSYDVAVVGAGLTGLTTALLLALSGARVVVLEARDVGAVTTGRSTAKVSALQGTRLSAIASRQGTQLLRQYVAGNEAARDWLLAQAEQLGVTVERRAAVTYAAGPGQVLAVRDELAAAESAGLAAQWREHLHVPFPALAGVRLPDQAQVDPVELLAALASAAEAAGVDIRTGARVRQVPGRGDELVTGRGAVRADRVVLATGIPVADRGGFFARLEPQRSYALALRVPEPPALDMYLSAGSPTRSVRTATWRGEELVLVGGNGHVVGRARSHRAHAHNLLSWSRTWFPGSQVVARWSAQDYHPVDELPYAGPLLPGSSRVLVATGYAKWGMTNAVAAAHVLAGLLGGERPAWADAFDSWGAAQERAALPTTARLNAGVGARLATDYGRLLLSPAGTGRTEPARARGAGDHGVEATAPGPDATDRTAPPEGQGCVVRQGLRPVGVSTVDGTTREVSARCPHLGGVLGWNDEERTWDCPLHGSRFGPDGALLEGPATRGLAQP